MFFNTSKTARKLIKTPLPGRGRIKAKNAADRAQWHYPRAETYAEAARINLARKRQHTEFTAKQASGDRVSDRSDVETQRLPFLKPRSPFVAP